MLRCTTLRLIKKLVLIMTKSYYIELISNASDKYGNKLVELMDKHNANNLQEITLEQAQSFYENNIVANDPQVKALYDRIRNCQDRDKHHKLYDELEQRKKELGVF